MRRDRIATVIFVAVVALSLTYRSSIFWQVLLVSGGAGSGLAYYIAHKRGQQVQLRQAAHLTRRTGVVVRPVQYWGSARMWAPLRS